MLSRRESKSPSGSGPPGETPTTRHANAAFDDRHAHSDPESPVDPHRLSSHSHSTHYGSTPYRMDTTQNLPSHYSGPTSPSRSSQRSQSPEPSHFQDTETDPLFHPHDRKSDSGSHAPSKSTAGSQSASKSDRGSEGKSKGGKPLLSMMRASSVGSDKGKGVVSFKDWQSLRPAGRQEDRSKKHYQQLPQDELQEVHHGDEELKKIANVAPIATKPSQKTPIKVSPFELVGSKPPTAEVQHGILEKFNRGHKGRKSKDSTGAHHVLRPKPGETAGEITKAASPRKNPGATAPGAGMGKSHHDRPHHDDKTPAEEPTTCLNPVCQRLRASHQKWHNTWPTTPGGHVKTFLDTKYGQVIAGSAGIGGVVAATAIAIPTAIQADQSRRQSADARKNREASERSAAANERAAHASEAQAIQQGYMQPNGTINPPRAAPSAPAAPQRGKRDLERHPDPAAGARPTRRWTKRSLVPMTRGHRLHRRAVLPLVSEQAPQGEDLVKRSHGSEDEGSDKKSNGKSEEYGAAVPRTKSGKTVKSDESAPESESLYHTFHPADAFQESRPEANHMMNPLFLYPSPSSKSQRKVPTPRMQEHLERQDSMHHGGKVRRIDADRDTQSQSGLARSKKGEGPSNQASSSSETRPLLGGTGHAASKRGGNTPRPQHASNPEEQPFLHGPEEDSKHSAGLYAAFTSQHADHTPREHGLNRPTWPRGHKHFNSLHSFTRDHPFEMEMLPLSARNSQLLHGSGKQSQLDRSGKNSEANSNGRPHGLSESQGATQLSIKEAEHSSARSAEGAGDAKRRALHAKSSLRDLFRTSISFRPRSAPGSRLQHEVPPPPPASPHSTPFGALASQTDSPGQAYARGVEHGRRRGRQEALHSGGGGAGTDPRTPGTSGHSAGRQFEQALRTDRHPHSGGGGGAGDGFGTTIVHQTTRPWIQTKEGKRSSVAWSAIGGVAALGITAATAAQAYEAHQTRVAQQAQAIHAGALDPRNSSALLPDGSALVQARPGAGPYSAANQTVTAAQAAQMRKGGDGGAGAKRKRGLEGRSVPGLLPRALNVEGHAEKSRENAGASFWKRDLAQPEAPAQRLLHVQRRSESWMASRLARRGRIRRHLRRARWAA